jgi:hypothetical protein
MPLATLGLLPLTLLACGGGDDRPATAKEGDAFCEAAEEAGETFDELDSLDFTDPDAVEDAIGDSVDAAKDVATIAPTDIKKEIDELVEVQEQFFELLEDNDFDFIAASADPDFEDLAADGEDASDELEEYLEDKCGIEPDDDDEADAPDESTATDAPDPGDLPAGDITKENFLDLFAIGSGVEITDEMRSCFADALSEVSDEEFNAAMNGGDDGNVQLAIGQAVITCGIPLEG